MNCVCWNFTEIQMKLVFYCYEGCMSLVVPKCSMYVWSYVCIMFGYIHVFPCWVFYFEFANGLCVDECVVMLHVMFVDLLFPHFMNCLDRCLWYEHNMVVDDGWSSILQGITCWWWRNDGGRKAHGVMMDMMRKRACTALWRKLQTNIYLSFFFVILCKM